MDNIINAKIELTDGRVINIELYPDIAPISVENFVSLIKNKYYDGLCFHRVIPNFMVQGGGFTTDGKSLKEKGGAKTIKGEFASNGVANSLSHTPGVLSMARTQVMDSASSQFFICVDDCQFLDGQYAAFGKVSDQQSLDTAIAISKTKTGRVGYYDDVPVSSVVIKAFTIV